MEESPHRSSPRLLVFTDLDATLLDDSYSWAPATSAIERLKGGQHCLVLSSSKTLAEMRALALELELDAPLVAENGATIAIPEHSSLLEPSDEGPVDDGFVISTQGASRPDILRLAHDLRETEGYAFSGFADWDAQAVADRTGLSLKSAVLALDRHGTEPIIWEDSPERWDTFAAILRSHGLKAIRGGRFIHLMGETDTARGLQEVVRRVQLQSAWQNMKVVALGDSPNDLGMLSAADFAVVIPNTHHEETLQPSAGCVIYANALGPIGWNKSMHILMDDLGIE